MQFELADPIYNFIRIDSEFNAQFLQNPRAQEEIFRAKNIACLGLVKYFIPAASHTKFEHHLGTYHLMRQSRRFLPHLSQRDSRLLNRLNFFSCFGYLPLGYCASEAVILAAQAEPEFRKKLLVTYLNPVLEAARGFDKKYTTNLNFIIDGYLYKALNSWFGAWKILQTGREFEFPGITTEEIIFTLIDNHNPLKKAYFSYATIDYLQRDLFFTGGGKIHLPLNKIFSQQKQGIIAPAYLLMIESMRSTLSTQVYCEPRHISLETWAKHRLAELLLSAELSLEDLLQGTDYSVVEKLNLKEQLPRFLASRTILQEEYFINMKEISKTDKIPRSRQEACAMAGVEKPGPAQGFILSANVHSLRVAYNQFHVISYTLQQIERVNFTKLLSTFHALSDLFTYSKIESGINLNAYLHGYAKNLLSFICRTNVSVDYDSVFYYLQNYFRKQQHTFSQFQQQLAGWIDEIQQTEDRRHNILRSHNINLKEYILDGKKLAFLLEYLMLGPIAKSIKTAIVLYLKNLIHQLQPKDILWPETKTFFLIYLHLLEIKIIQSVKTIICPLVRIPSPDGKEKYEIDFILIDLKYKELHFYLSTTGKTREVFATGMQKLQEIITGLHETFDQPAYSVNFIGPENYPYNFPAEHNIINPSEILKSPH